MDDARIAQGRLWYQFDTIHPVAMTLRTDAELEKALAALSSAEGASRQEIVRSNDRQVGRRAHPTRHGVNQPHFLDLEDLLGLVRSLNAGPVRDVGLLYSAAGRPRSAAFGEDAYPTVALKAAALLHSPARNHALVDGNKRLAWLATVVFLDLNSYEPDLTDDAAFELVMDAAEGTVDVEQIASRLSLAPH